jgi:hypothetical protein
MKNLIAITLSALMFLTACGTSTPPAKTTTLSSTISNLGEAELDPSQLTVKANIYISGQKKVIAQSKVFANGGFTLELPQLTIEQLSTDDFNPADCPDVTYSITTFKTNTLFLELYENDQPAYGDGEIFYANGPLVGGQNQASYIFSDTDLSLVGKCDTGLGELDIDLNLKKGWNWIILGEFPDGERLGFFSAVPDSSYKWLVPVCTIGCSSLRY